MRIDLNAGGLKGMISVASFAADYTKLINDSKKVVSSFKAVESQVHNMSGGAGNLQEALDHIENRIKNTDEKKIEKLENAGQRFAMFIVNTVNTDKRVAETIALANKEFYNENPWAIPPKPKKWYQKVGDWFKGVGKKIGSAFKKAATWLADKVKKAWNATVNFIKKHYKTILKIVAGAVLIAGLFALSAVTGGAAAGIFALAAKAAVTAALTSTATSVVSGIVQGKSAGEIFDSAGDSFFKGAVTGAISGAVGGVGPAVLESTGSAFFAKGAEILAKGAGKFLGGMITEGADYLEKNGTLSGFFGDYAKNAGISVLEGMAGDALGAVGGYMKEKGLSLVTSTFKNLGGGGLGKAFSGMISTISEKAPWFIGENGVISGIGDLAKLRDPKGFLTELGGKAFDSIIGGKVNDLVSSGLTTISDKLGISDIVGKIGTGRIMDIPGLSDLASQFKGTLIDTSKKAFNTLCGSGFADAISSSLSKTLDFKKSISINIGPLSMNGGVSLSTSGASLGGSWKLCLR